MIVLPAQYPNAKAEWDFASCADAAKQDHDLLVQWSRGKADYLFQTAPMFTSPDARPTNGDCEAVKLRAGALAAWGGGHYGVSALIAPLDWCGKSNSTILLPSGAARFGPLAGALVHEFCHAWLSWKHSHNGANFWADLPLDPPKWLSTLPAQGSQMDYGGNPDTMSGGEVAAMGGPSIFHMYAAGWSTAPLVSVIKDTTSSLIHTPVIPFLDEGGGLILDLRGDKWKYYWQRRKKPTASGTVWVWNVFVARDLIDSWGAGPDFTKTKSLTDKKGFTMIPNLDGTLTVTRP